MMLRLIYKHMVGVTVFLFCTALTPMIATYCLFLFVEKLSVKKSVFRAAQITPLLSCQPRVTVTYVLFTIVR